MFPAEGKSDKRAIPFLPGKKLTLRSKDKKVLAFERIPLLNKYLEELLV
jgi:hypothetical protein